MRILPAQVKHLPEVTAIYNIAIEERIATSDTQPRTLEQMTAVFEQNQARYPYLVALEDEQVVGFAFLYPLSPREGYRFSAENAVYVRRDYRGNGLGKKLLQSLLVAAKDSGLHYILARVFAHNPASQAIHRSLGFNSIGVQKEVASMDGKWFDVVLFERLL
jgi:phosphinothricin acetyltransferase